MTPYQDMESFPSWFYGEGSDQDIVISTRVRISRNVEGFEFCPRMSLEDKRDIITSFFSHARRSPELSGYSPYFLDGLNNRQKGILAERRFISNRLFLEPGYGCLINNQQNLSVVLNDREHLKICGYLGGLELMECYKHVETVLKTFEESCSFSRNGQGHYLTSRISDYGTGMKITVLLQLTGLTASGKVDRILKEVLQRGVSIRGIYNSRMDSLGDYYMISNECGFSVSDKEIIENINILLNYILEEERQARKLYLEDSSATAADEVFQAYKTLARSKSLSLTEALESLMILRFGISCNLMSGIPLKLLDALAILAQDEHIKTLFFKEDSTPDDNLIDYKRAEFVQNMLKFYRR